ncbi:hypothetical protein B0H21DRAFT_699322, partial [Amylocystis lapponica]
QVYSLPNATGRGVERSVLIRAVALMVEDYHFWADRGEYKIPSFLPVNASVSVRLWRWKAFGTLCALYVLHLGSGPLPATMAFLDRDAAWTLHPWISLSPSGPITDTLKPALSQFLINQLSMQLSTVLAARVDEAGHNALTPGFTAQVLFGNKDLWNHVEHAAFREGFDLRFKPTQHHSMIQVFYSVDSLDLDPMSPLSIVAAMYDRQIKGPDQIITRLEVSPSTGLDRELQCFQRLFELRLARYLRGMGHPRTRDLVQSQLISDAQFLKAQNDPILRCQLFLMALTEKDTLPVGNNWSIEVRSLLFYIEVGSNCDV